MWFDGFLGYPRTSWFMGRGLLSGGTFAVLAAGLWTAVPAETGWAQQPTIRHAQLDCLPNDQYPMVLALIEPVDEIRTCKVYFRSDRYIDFYYVEMERESETQTFQAVLPMPSEETSRVVYYLECVDQSFNGVRTEEFAPEVMAGSDCGRRQPGAAWFTGENPGVIVGATRAGMAAVPPGFKAAGIVGFVSAAGVSSAVGGGIGAGTVAAVGAGAAAAATGIAVAAGGRDQAPSPPAGPSPAPSASAPTTSIPPTTTTAPSMSNEAPRACFAVEPDPPVIQTGEFIRLDASCSTADQSGSGTDTITQYRWDLGDGRRKEGRVITPVYPEAGVFTITLTVTDSGGSSYTTRFGRARTADVKTDTASIQVTVEEEEVPQDPEPPPAALSACFTATPTSMCALTLDASCSTGPIIGYTWILDYFNVFQTKTASGVVVNADWYPLCVSATPIKIRLTVQGSGGTSDVLDQTVTLFYSRAPQKAEQQLSTSFASFLDMPPADGAQGQVLLNGERLDVTESGAQVRHSFFGRRGENTVVARTTETGGEGLWRFDFHGSEYFTPGSLRIPSGQVVSMDAYSVVFRVSQPGERMEIHFELSSERR